MEDTPFPYERSMGTVFPDLTKIKRSSLPNRGRRINFIIAYQGGVFFDEMVK
jgi:hypothetical protein